MQKEVWKFEIDLDKAVRNHYTLLVPRNSLVISVNAQREKVCLWMLVDPDEKEKETRKYIAAGTGKGFTYDSAMNFLGTVLLRGGLLVYHIFEQTT